MTSFRFVLLAAGFSAALATPASATSDRYDHAQQNTGVQIAADTRGWRPGPGVPPVRPPNWNENDWIALGSARFGNREGETTVDGANGRHFKQVGLRARGGDGQCRAVVIRFTNGEKITLQANGGRPMREGQLYAIDLPGWKRNILRLALACRAVHSDYTSIQVYASR